MMPDGKTKKKKASVKGKPKGRSATTAVHDDLEENKIDVSSIIMNIETAEEKHVDLSAFPLPGGLPRTDMYYELLHILAKESKFAIDIGTCEGASAFAMSNGLDCRVVTIDSKDCGQRKAPLGGNVEVFLSDALSYLVKRDIKDGIDLVFIDADPEIELVSNLFDHLSKRMSDNGVIIIDDVNWKRKPKFVSWWKGFNPKGFKKITNISMHQTEEAGIGILIKQ